MSSQQSLGLTVQRSLEPLCLGQKLQFNYATYDIETLGIGNLDLGLIGLFDGEKYKAFFSMSEFLDACLVRKYANWRFFAHYGGKFDIRFVFEHIREKMPTCEFEFFCSGSTVISFSVYKKSETSNNRLSWHFTDSGRLLPSNLKSLTYEFDVEHKKLDFNPESLEYNEHDCRGLYEVLVKFFGTYEICSETIASHSMKVFRTHFLKRSIPQPHSDVEEFVRTCYFGGRCEVYRWDEMHVQLYDINSMYPWAMRGPIPVAYRCRTTDLVEDDEIGIGFYEADVEYPEVYVPVLPYFLDKLYFPQGKMTVRCTSMELRQAIMDGAKVKIRRGCIFDTDHLFNEYVDEIYKMKKEADASGDGGKRTIAKLLLNTLYGKFGQRRRQISYAFDPGTAYLYGDYGPRVWPLEKAPGLCYYYSDSTSPHILPHIAATVTARARLNIVKYQREARQIYYTDTDSIFTKRPIQTGKELGEMSLKGEGKFQAHGLKEYVFGNELALKGVPLTVTDEKTGKKTTDYTLGNRYLRKEQIEYTRMIGFMEAIRKGQSTLQYITVKKLKHAIVEKRARDGAWDTRPWLVSELKGMLIK